MELMKNVFSFLGGVAVATLILTLLPKPTTNAENFVLPRDKWQCFVVLFETDECVAYRLRTKELEDLDARHRKHNPKQRAPFHNTK